MSLDPIRTKKFRDTLATKKREDLLRLIKLQDEETYEEVLKIESVFRNQLGHLKWADGEDIIERDLTNEELASLIDEPFEPSEHLYDLGLNAEKQRELHLISDPVLWAKNFLKDPDGDPIHLRAYQALMLRNPSERKVMRWGRRLGKSFSMTILMLHRAITQQNYRVVVVAPEIKHTKVLYDEIIGLIDANEYLQVNIPRAVQSPSPEINFLTGSTIKFFTAGTKSAGNANSTRGQEADLIILDEMDYLHPDDLIAVMAMLQDTKKNRQKKILVGASTPSGAHEVFYDWCTARDSIFTEFYFPAYVNPHWGPEMEAEMRHMYKSPNAYKHEVEADWGDNQEGVYPRRYLDTAFDNSYTWEYEDYRTSVGDFFIGVDWDKYGAGTNICVIERCAKDHYDQRLAGKLRLVYREETPRDEFTYTKAVRRVIELNEKFNPKYIYVDRGAGETQVELLHEEGIRNPFSGLGKKVKGISFKEIIVARDPFTKREEKKETKPFMVDNLYQMLENELLAIPASDTDLYHQLLSYIRVRQTQTGQPVFGTINDGPDHAHDALILACLAFTQNYGQFFNIGIDAKPKALSNKFFMPMYVDEARGPKSENTRLHSPYEPSDDIIDEKPSKITRSVPFAARGSKNAYRRKSF